MTNRPEITLRDGTLKATIWKRSSDKGAFYSVELSRFYKDEQDQYQTSHTFSRNELLRISRLAQKAYDAIEELAQDAADTEEAA